LPRWVWNISREGDSTASLGSLGQGSVTLRGKKFFLIFRRNFLSFSLWRERRGGGGEAQLTESQNSRGWKGPLWVTQSNPLPKQGYLQQVVEDLVQASPLRSSKKTRCFQAILVIQKTAQACARLFPRKLNTAEALRKHQTAASRTAKLLALSSRPGYGQTVKWTCLQRRPRWPPGPHKQRSSEVCT